MPRSETSAADFLPERWTMRSLPAAARACRGCDLWRNATQTVFGEGLKRARVMLVGEMPGNDEDLAGHPFVGPAGRILDRALDEAHIDRRDAYVTNIVKHFKWDEHGRFVASDLALQVTATGHPSAVLRQRDAAARDAAMRALVADLRKVAKVLNGG